MKTFSQKFSVQISLKKFLWLKRLKILWRGHIISDLNGEEIVWTFYEKELHKQNKLKKKVNQKEFRIEKVIKKKGQMEWLW